jgi:ferritin-like metal-binding protein YciE
MAKANKKAAAKSVKAAAPKKGAKSAKAAAPKKGFKSAKAAAPKKGFKSAKAAAPKKVFKAAKAAAPKKVFKAAKAAAPKKGFKSAKAAAPKKVAVAKKAARPKAASPSTDQRPMLEALFIDHLKDIYWAEKHLTKALPKMRKAATSSELQQAFDDHLQVTQEQITRLDQVFEMIGKKAQGKKCDAMAGLVMEAESVITDTEKGSKTRDVGLIIAAQKVEHYEIASYGGLATLAKTLGMEEAKNLLGQTLEEEKQTDALLSQIAENNINLEAAQEGGSEETEDGEDEDGAAEEGIKLPKEEEEGEDEGEGEQ